MPCDSSGYHGPDARQVEASRVKEFLKEIYGLSFDHAAAERRGESVATHSRMPARASNCAAATPGRST